MARHRDSDGRLRCIFGWGHLLIERNLVILELLSGQFNRFTIIIAYMWALLALASALCLGVYDIFKKISLRDNNVVMVLLLNTVFGALLMSPVLILSLIHI